MSAWFLAALLCAPVSAQVVETGGAAVSAAPGSIGAVAGAGSVLSPIPVVPGASTLVPSLNTASALQAFTGAPAAGRLPAGVVGFAPALPALPAAAAVVGAVPGAAPAPTAHPADESGSAPVSRDALPPPSALAKAAVPAVASGLRRAEGSDDASGRAGGGLEKALDEAGNMARVSLDGALAAGRRLFDRDGSRSALAEGAAVPAGAAPVSEAAALERAGGPEEPAPVDGLTVSGGEVLRDAVASPVPAAPSGAGLSFARVFGAYGGPVARPGGAAAPAFSISGSAVPVSLTRLSLELKDGLVVTVRAALGLPAGSGARRPFAAAARAGAPAAELAAARTPVTSTEWLERRGLLESLSASEAAAEQTAAELSRAAPAPVRAFVSAHSPAPSSLSAFRFDATVPSRVPPLVWWSLAFLPAALVFLKELE